LRYDNNIDTQIIEILRSSDTSSFNELLKKVKEYRRRKTLSRSVFTFHLNKLVNHGVVDKHDEGLRGKKVYYFLTDFGKQQLQLYPSTLWEDKERLEIVYQLLFFFVSQYQDTGLTHRLDSDDEFENFLSRIRVSKGDLVVESVRRDNSGGIYPRDGKIYDSRTITAYSPVLGVKIRKEDHHDCKWFSPRAMNLPYENRQKRTYRITYDNQGKLVMRYARRKEIEERAIALEKVKIDDFSWYYYTFPVAGVSVSDVTDHKDFLYEHGGLTREEVKRAFDLLKEMDLVKPSGVLFGELRYVFNPAHRILKELLNEYWKVQFDIYAKLNWIWHYIRKPTSAERKWLELFYGEKRAGDYMRSAYNHRHRYRHGLKHGKSLGKILRTFTDMSKEEIEKVVQNMTMQEKEKMIRDLQKDLVIPGLDKDYVELVISDFDKNIKSKIRELEKMYADTIKKYHFPLKSLGDLVYPKHIINASYKVK
jgi:DNA-binding HxlR family transcriptional regulator